MIFVTVGEQLPFDRLIRTMDEWASCSDRKVFAQIGESLWEPTHIAYKKFLSPEAFREKIQSAELVVAHAGMGTIISAMGVGKPLLVMPRQKALGEVRNDHQLATARRFMALNYVSVAFDELELKIMLGNIEEIIKKRQKGVATKASKDLLEKIRSFIESN